jgi:hypothetical protein
VPCFGRQPRTAFTDAADWTHAKPRDVVRSTSWCSRPSTRSVKVLFGGIDVVQPSYAIPPTKKSKQKPTQKTDRESNQLFGACVLTAW